MSVRLDTQESLRSTAQTTHRALAIQNLEAGLQVTDLPGWHRCFAQLKYACILKADSLHVSGFCRVH